MPSDELTALVILRPASGKRAAEAGPVTAQNIQEHLPTPEALQTALQALQDAGFQTGTRVGNTFSITASREAFEGFFHTKIDPNRTANLQLPVVPHLASVVETVTFDAPRDLY